MLQDLLTGQVQLYVAPTANVMPLVASNRIGTEKGEKLSITFYGHSFIADHTGAIVAQADDHSEQVITATFDLEEIRQYRHSWGLFRDRRPEWKPGFLAGDRRRPAAARWT